MTEKNQPWTDVLADLLIAGLDESYHLVDVAYDDKLTAEQVEMVVAGDWERLWDHSEWESDSRRDGAQWHAELEAKDNLRRIFHLNTTRTDAELRSLLVGSDISDEATAFDEFKDSDAWDRLIEAISDRDSSNPYSQLAGHTGYVLMRQLLAAEDDWWDHEPLTASQVIGRIAGFDGEQYGHREVTVAFKRNTYNIGVVREVLRECSPEFSLLAPQLVYAVDVADLYDAGDCEYVEITDPHLLLGNPFTGTGWCSDDPIRGTFRIPRGDLTTDKGAFGYGWDEIAGVVTSAYKADFTAGPAVTANAA